MVNANPQPGAFSSRLSLYEAAVNVLAAKRRKQAAYAEMDRSRQMMANAEIDLVQAYLRVSGYGDGQSLGAITFKSPSGKHWLIEMDIAEGLITCVREVDEVSPNRTVIQQMIQEMIGENNELGDTPHD
jgi:hypothetical protein